MRFLLAYALLALLAANVELGGPSRRTKRVNVASAFAAAKITNFTIPQGYLGVTFESNERVNLGNEIYPGKTIKIRSIEYNAYPGDYFTLVLLDIDFPTAAYPYLGPNLRGIWVNIVKSDFQSADVVARYVPPTPPPGTGVHRNVFYYYRQEKRIDAQSISYLNVVLGRFDLEGFVRNNTLCLEAGNFYRTQFPDDLEESCIQDICERRELQGTIDDFTVV